MGSDSTCYSAQVVADFKKLSRQYRSSIDFDEFLELYAFHSHSDRPKSPQDALRRSLTDYRADPEHWQGWDWCELSPEESEVFNLSPAR